MGTDKPDNAISFFAKPLRVPPILGLPVFLGSQRVNRDAD